MTVSTPERRFLELVPFYVNDTLQGEDRTWFEAYLAQHPEASAEIRFAQKIRAEVQAIVRERPQDAGLDELLKKIRQQNIKPISWATRIMQWWQMQRPVGPVWATAMALLVVQAITFGVLLDQHATSEDGLPSVEGYRGSQLQIEARMKVIFSPDARQADVVQLIRQAGAYVVSGPSESGEWWLALPTSGNLNLENTLAILKANPAVDEVTVLPEKSGH